MQAAQHGLDRAWLVRVINHRQEILTFLDQLHATGHLHVLQSLHCCVVASERVSRGGLDASQGHQAVGLVKGARHANAVIQLAWVSAAGDGKVNVLAAAGSHLSRGNGPHRTSGVGRVVASLRVQSHGRRVLSGDRTHALAPLVLAADHSGARNAPILHALEQQRLGLEVVLHRRVEIQVILAQVRKRHHVEVHAAHAAQLQSVAGYLHHQVRGAFGNHACQQGLQRGRLRSGQRGRNRLAIDTSAGGTDQPHLQSGIQQGLLYQVAGGGLAGCAGDANGLQLAGRVAVHLRRHRTHPLANVVDDDAR